MSSARSSGFTLIEVMVALVIVALTVPALLFTLDQQIDGTAYMRDKSFARMVAANQLAELRLTAAASGQILRGSDAGAEELAGREWHWWLESTATEIPDFYRVSVRVARDEADREAPLVTVVGYLSASADNPDA